MGWLSARRSARSRREQAKELERAYRSVFLCPEGQAVLSDLAAESGMYLAPLESMDQRQSGYADGRKAMLARILSMIRISDEEHAALQEAARFETLPKLPNEED